MTELELRKQFVSTAKKYLGCKEADGSHRKIIDIYNNHEPLARNYKVTYTDAWCATYVSAISIECDLTDIIPTECSCNNMIKLHKALGTWKEADNYRPSIGDIMMYDWDDSGRGDNKGEVEHVGIVTEIFGNSITVIEGNKNNAVEYRKIIVDGRYIRGYCVPDFAKKANKVEKPDTSKTYKPTVLEWQKAAIADGFKFPKYGADGVWGAECVSVAKKAIVKKRIVYKYKNLTRIVQRVVGVTVDGLCGKDTKAAIKKYQKAAGFAKKEIDGEVGINTWKKILGI